MLVWSAPVAKAAKLFTAPARAVSRQLVDWITFYTRLWHDQFDRLEDLLKKMDQ